MLLGTRETAVMLPSTEALPGWREFVPLPGLALIPVGALDRGFGSDPPDFHAVGDARDRGNASVSASGWREFVPLPGLALIPIGALDRGVPVGALDRGFGSDPPDFHAVGDARDRGNAPKYTR